jgi:hypothetical protein
LEGFIVDTAHSSFRISVEARVTNTGPVPAVMSPFEADMVYEGGVFGKLKIPEVHTSPSGCEVNLYDQLIQILDYEAWMAFVKAIVTQDKLALTLDNGHCTITAMRFLKGNCVYRKAVVMKGMKGPATTIKNTTAERIYTNVFNPSPVDIDHGLSMFEIQSADGEVIAELKGDMRIARNNGEVIMNITRKTDVPLISAEGIRLVGKGTDGQAWTDASIKYIQVPLTLTDQFLSFYKQSNP